MENHPIPQDVTGFQFKLVGNMTIKQFVYLGVGVVLAWITYVAPLNNLIKLPFALLFAFSGFCLAFLPIDGRPLDSMLLYFIKALFTPNQYIFEKGTNITYIATPVHTTLQNPQTPAVQKNIKPIQQPAVLPQQTDEQPKNLEYEKIMTQFKQTQTENKRLEQELASLKQILSQTQQPMQIKPQPSSPPLPPIQPIPVQTPPPVTKPMVKKTTVAPLARATGLPTPDVPNILMGIVKDPRGNMLANILVEVKDKDGSPVRAFKTNGLGQFASATPLPNGVYTLEFEDTQGKQRFDALELTMNGEIIGPIEATSVDQREILRKSLFPNT